MKTIKSTTTFATVDGREFTDQASAARHEKLLLARQAYDAAKDALGKMLAERCLTADGKRFQVGLWQRYYWITPGYFAPPDMRHVEFWGRNWTWQESSDGSDTLVLISFSDDLGADQARRGQDIPINELYASEEACRAALAVARRKWLTEKLQELGN